MPAKKVKKIRLSFKKEPQQTGLAGVGNPYSSTHIKIDGFKVGTISPPNWSSKDNLWTISLAIANPDKESNCEFKWIFLKKRPENEPDARVWLKEFIQPLTEKYDLYSFTD